MLPLTISNADSVNNSAKFHFDINLIDEKIYKFKVKLFTSNHQIPYIEIPYTVISTNLDVEEAIQFDSNNFYVKNNKYFISLLKLIEKEKEISIINTQQIPITINSIQLDSIKDKFNVNNIEIDIKSKINLPFVLTNENKFNITLSFLGKEFGHSSAFLILNTNLGQVYLHFSTFVNTKSKDIYVMMENIKGTEFVSPLFGSDVDYIELINFGDDISLLDITKLGYDQDEF
jgi:hypothetical protein